MQRNAENPDPGFKQELIALRPSLRAFAHSLCGGPQQAEDLAQETLLNAWKSRHSYQAGTSIKAWCFTILRNEFYSIKRREWRRPSLDPDVAAQTLKSNDGHRKRLELLTLRNALEELPDQQREAVLLIGVGGLSYREAAQICGCAVGTLKSRVSRGRQALDARIGSRDLNFTPDDELGSSEVLEYLIDETQDLIEDQPE